MIEGWSRLYIWTWIKVDQVIAIFIHRLNLKIQKGLKMGKSCIQETLKSLGKSKKFRKILKILKNLENFEKSWKFWKILENLENFEKAWKSWKILRIFLKNYVKFKGLDFLK